jgi:hypothetical protein
MTARQKAMTGIASRRGAFFLPLHLEGWGVLGKLGERPLAVGGETAMGSRPLEPVETRIIRQGYKRNFKIFPHLNRTSQVLWPVRDNWPNTSATKAELPAVSVVTDK